MNRRYRKTIIAGNWKMNKLPAETKEFIGELKSAAAAAKWCEIVLCVPAVSLQAAVRAARNTKIEIAAQNMHQESSGAYTGEISGEMLADIGVKYVVIGHSERREYFNETDTSVALKVKSALKCGLRPIVCVGESNVQREMNMTTEHLRLQIKSIFNGIDGADMKKIVIAYEPLWAIGTGKTATSAQADEAGSVIRNCIRELYDARHARAISIVYGGSMNAKNSASLLAMPDVDGGLIGGASLNIPDFEAIILAAKD